MTILDLIVIVFWRFRNLKPLPEKIDVIVPSSFGVLPDRLSKATRASVERAIYFNRFFPKSLIVFGNCSHCFPGSGDFEFGEKIAIFCERQTPFVNAGNIVNTITEAEAVKECLGDSHSGMQKAPKKILVISSIIHAPSAQLIWQEIFPKAKIFIAYISDDPWLEVEPNHTIWAQRTRWGWFLANVFRHAVLRLPFIGFWLARRFVHPTSVKSSSSSSSLSTQSVL